MTYILILAVWAYSGIALTSVEFGSREACQTALDASKKLASTLGSGSNAICVPSGHQLYLPDPAPATAK